jgi:hypothetical protein
MCKQRNDEKHGDYAFDAGYDLISIVLWIFLLPFPLFLSFDKQHISGGETTASPKGGISIHLLMYFCPGECS